MTLSSEFSFGFHSLDPSFFLALKPSSSNPLPSCCISFRLRIRFSTQLLKQKTYKQHESDIKQKIINLNKEVFTQKDFFFRDRHPPGRFVTFPDFARWRRLRLAQVPRRRDVLYNIKHIDRTSEKKNCEQFEEQT